MSLETINALLVPMETALDRQYFIEEGRIAALNGLESMLKNNGDMTSKALLAIIAMRALAFQKRDELAMEIANLKAADKN